MHVRRLPSVLVTAAALAVLTASPAAAGGPPPETPTGGGCQANGQAIAGAAQTFSPFGQIVRGNAPIADDNAAFFGIFCG
jgi:hypothetical protein